MIEKIQSNLVRILEDLYGDSHLNIDELKINLQENNDKKHGDLASNIALILAKPLKKKSTRNCRLDKRFFHHR